MTTMNRWMRKATGVALTAAMMSASLAAAAAPAPRVSIDDGETAAQRTIVDARHAPRRTPMDGPAAAVTLASGERAARCAIDGAPCSMPASRRLADASAFGTVAIAEGEQAAQRAIAAPAPYRRSASGAAVRAALAR